MRTLMWFRTDLRVLDNPAFSHAVSDSSRGVVAAFVISPEQWQRHDDAPIKIDFILRNLTHLSRELTNLNIALRIVHAPAYAGVPRALLHLAQTESCDALYFNRNYEFNEQQRDEAVADEFRSVHIPCRLSSDQCMVEPGSLRTGKGTFYSVFTPFKRAWFAAVHENGVQLKPLERPHKQETMIGAPDPIPEQVAGFKIDFDAEPRWPAGEQQAHRRLASFIKNGLDHYGTTRDRPDIEGTSQLSPYLTSGVVSIRQCLAAACAANGHQLDTGSPGSVQWISELVWREFYKHILVGFPRVSMHRAFKKETERLAWSDRDDHFRAWCEGRTGVPIVDAAMRQLNETGWMHNRLRMIVAMFLSKNLFLDWRHGERYFMQHLIDGDLSANNGGWQWAASTGTDAAPYFRIFNPYAQSQRFDPDGVFIRRFIPELAHLETAYLHDPSTVPALARGQLDYPEPIVDVAQSRTRAIAAFKSL